MPDHRHLLSPLPLRGHPLRNRIVFGAHTNNMAEAGLPGARTRDYLLERAIGGAGMIVCEPMPVHRTTVLTRGNYLPGTDAVIVQQLYHLGAHGDSDLSFAPHWSPSGQVSYHDSDGSHRITTTEIEEIIAAHVAAAIRCQNAGFQGGEIWAAYQSLLEQFWTPWSNRRDDNWGGSLENRTRISRRIVEGIRRAWARTSSSASRSPPRMPMTSRSRSRALPKSSRFTTRAARSIMSPAGTAAIWISSG